MAAILSRPQCVNPNGLFQIYHITLWLDDAIWWHGWWISDNIGSSNGMLPDGTKPLPKPMLIYHHWACVLFTGEQSAQSVKLIWKLKKITATSPTGHSVKKCHENLWDIYRILKVTSNKWKIIHNPQCPKSFQRKCIKFFYGQLFTCWWPITIVC